MYSARQQYLPIALVLVVDDEVADPPTRLTAPPICVPSPVSQPTPAVTSFGRHKKNYTEPVGVGPVPDTVALSDADVPGPTVTPVGLEVVSVVDVCFSVSKHSSIKSV